MKVTKVLTEALGMVSRTIGIIYAWLEIIFDWTDEVKAASDSTIERYRRERDVDNQIADAELNEELKKKLKEAGIKPKEK